VIERAFIMAETDVDAECISLAGTAAAPADADENLGIRVGMSNAEWSGSSRSRRSTLRREEAYRRSARDQPQDPLQPLKAYKG